MKKPVILISCGYETPRVLPQVKSYAARESNTNAIEDAGGIPFIAPYWKDAEAIKQMVAMVDGVFMPGGDDIEPSEYGEQKRVECQGTVPERDAFELAVIKEAIAQDKPMICICRGLQALNVALGGSLYQDITFNTSTDVFHPDYTTADVGCHDVTLEKDSILYGIFGKDTLFVNSLHHQGIKDLAPGLKVTATAPDGLIEGVELPGKKYVSATQFHPEFMPGKEQYIKIFADFIENCKKYM